MNQLVVNLGNTVADTLGVLAGAGNFNRWMFERIEPFCGGEILEAGSGIGNLSHFLIEAFDNVTLSDVDPAYCGLLERRFSSCPSFKGVCRMDLGASDIGAVAPELTGRFDTVIALNVVEHIADDQQAVRNCAALLRPGGRLVVLVPAYQGLYNELDRGLGHYRRYTSRRLAALMREQGLEVYRSDYFNAAGLLGWWFTGSVLKMKVMEPRFLSFYNRFVPVFRLLDRIIGRKAGLSVLALACKAQDLK